MGRWTIVTGATIRSGDFGETTRGAKSRCNRLHTWACRPTAACPAHLTVISFGTPDLVFGHALAATRPAIAGCCLQAPRILGTVSVAMVARSTGTVRTGTSQQPSNTVFGASSTPRKQLVTSLVPNTDPCGLYLTTVHRMRKPCSDTLTTSTLAQTEWVRVPSLQFFRSPSGQDRRGR